MHNNRYSYPPGSGYSGSPDSPPPESGYQQASGGRPYYPSSNARVGGQFYPPIAPAPSNTSDRYSRSNYRPSGPEYSTASPYPYPDNRGYPNEPPSTSYSYNPSAPRAISPPVSYHRPSTSQVPPRGFIPTPSEAYAHPSRPPRPSSAMHAPSQAGNPYATASMGISPPSSRSHYPSSSRPKSSMSTSTMASSSNGERFACDVCGKDFSRAHDRKRHHETQHATTPITHKCVYCNKDFSRADSLKRHIQNGCDEAPQQ
ncbi:hypothetical protein DFH07DRAFT_764498 [Mycena maculata]|uniref:C2H2-type domain-containing protein n=1 Tax=Mycena maculata TaxID=230809 RepID=A0AAD7NZV1_9AGAR|nr:hypothetical protein DFH07DRAFT_764498 [Mycena maculata]